MISESLEETVAAAQRAPDVPYAPGRMANEVDPMRSRGSQWLSLSWEPIAVLSVDLRQELQDLTMFDHQTMACASVRARHGHSTDGFVGLS